MSHSEENSKVAVKFSVIIPTYNRANCILKTIDSVLSQSYPAYEIIVVDNCSTDNTNEVLSSLINDGKIKFIRHEKNFERSVSRNTGMRNASGDFLTFLDSDDFLYPDSLQLAFDLLQQKPAAKIFHHYYELINSNREKVYSFSFPDPASNLSKEIFYGNFLSCIGVYISKEVYQNYLFDETPEAIGSEDWDFWIRILADHQLEVIPEIAAGIVQHENRSVAGMSYSKILERKDYYLKKYSGSSYIAKKIKPYLSIFESAFFQYAAIISFQSKKYAPGYKLLYQSFRKHPGSIAKQNFWKILLSPIKKIIKS